MEDKDIGKPLQNWQPLTNKADLAHLGKLGEEVNELGAAINRCIIQGIDEAEPETHKPNRLWLEDEIADVLAMIDHAIIHFKLDQDRISERSSRKFIWKATWFTSLGEKT